MKRRKTPRSAKNKIQASRQVQAMLSDRRRLTIGIAVAAILLFTLVFFVIRSFTHSALSAPPEIHTPEPVRAVQAVSIEGTSAIVVDIGTGEVVIEKEPDITVPIASITKIATISVALRYLEPNDALEVQSGDFASTGGSSLRAGDTWRIADLMEYALITSSNEAVNAIARAVSEKRNSSFTEMLNEFAQENNLFQTHFVNPSGLDIHTGLSGSESSARDVASLLTLFYRTYPSYAAATSLAEKTFVTQNGATYKAQNTNKILTSTPSILASKTGYTGRAGGNLGVIARVGEKPFAVVVLGSSRAGRFTDIQSLIEQTEGIVLPQREQALSDEGTEVSEEVSV